MALTAKKEIIEKFGKNADRISHLTGHLKVHPKDVHSRVGLLKLIGKRRRLLNYVKNRNVDDYRNLIEKLGIRK